MLEVALESRHIHLGYAARLTLRLAGKDTGLAVQRSDGCRLCLKLLQDLFRRLPVGQNDIKVHGAEGGFGIGENIPEARRHFLPLALQGGIGAELVTDGIGNRAGECLDACDHGFGLLHRLRFRGLVETNSLGEGGKALAEIGQFGLLAQCPVQPVAH